MCAEAFVGTGASEGMASGVDVEGQKEGSREDFVSYLASNNPAPENRVLDMSRRDQFSASCWLTADRLESTGPGSTSVPPRSCRTPRAIIREGSGAQVGRPLEGLGVRCFDVSG